MNRIATKVLSLLLAMSLFMSQGVISYATGDLPLDPPDINNTNTLPDDEDEEQSNDNHENDENNESLGNTGNNGNTSNGSNAGSEPSEGDGDDENDEQQGDDTDPLEDDILGEGELTDEELLDEIPAIELEEQELVSHQEAPRQ